MESFWHIRGEMMDQMGLSGADLDEAMRSRYNRAVKENPDYKLDQAARDLVGSRDKIASAESEKEAFSADDLDSDTYTAYAEQRASDYRNIIDGFDRSPQYRALDEATKKKAESAAYDLADETALEDQSDGQYQITTKWMTYADDAKAKGIDRWKYVLFHTVYSQMESTKDKNGDPIKGQEKSDRVRQWLESNSSLTNDQKEFLLVHCVQ